MIYDWQSDQERIVDRIASRATLKICCKVRDEPLLTEAWIEHHAAIVGPENIIVADNMSADPAMVEILERYSSRVTVFRFSGPHNAIHWHHRFRPLFQAIRESSRFVSFIDIDERLVHIKGDRWGAGPEIPEELAACGDDEIIATTWPVNALNSHDRFCVAREGEDNRLVENLRWGKPILPASLAGAQHGMHNANFVDFRFSAAAGTGFFLLHLTEFPERRIRSNLNKLVSRGLIDEGTTADQVLNANLTGLEGESFMPLIDEMRRMRRLLDAPQSAADHYAGHSYFGLGADGRLKFEDQAGTEALAAFVESGARHVEEVFNAALPAPQALAEQSYARAINALNDGEETAAEALLAHGMQAFPHLRHRYDGPAFRKELLRMYASTRDWARARRLIPAGADEFSAHWHCILFARAHSDAGHAEEAQFWWNEVLRHEPDNGEAKAAMAGIRADFDRERAARAESVLRDLEDVTGLIDKARTQPHWFMTKYFDYAGLTVDDGHRRLLSMTERAASIARERVGEGPAPLPGPRIPRILHKVWLTNPAAPSEPLEDYVGGLMEDATRLAQSGWQTCLWLQDPDLVPKTVDRIRQSGAPIVVRPIADHIRDGAWRGIFDRFIADRKFPFAADILRMVILHRHGGIYADLGVRIADVAIANLVADDFDYGFIFWDTMFFQNSLMAMAPDSELPRIFMKLVDDPYLVPRSLIEPVTALTEGQAFSGLMVTAILLSIWRPEMRVFPFAPNRRLLSWSSQQSWYSNEGKYGNTYVPESRPSFYVADRFAERRDGPANVLAR